MIILGIVEKIIKLFGSKHPPGFIPIADVTVFAVLDNSIYIGFDFNVVESHINDIMNELSEDRRLSWKMLESDEGRVYLLKKVPDKILEKLKRMPENQDQDFGRFGSDLWRRISVDNFKKWYLKSRP